MADSLSGPGWNWIWFISFGCLILLCTPPLLGIDCYPRYWANFLPRTQPHAHKHSCAVAAKHTWMHNYEKKKEKWKPNPSLIRTWLFTPRDKSFNYKFWLTCFRSLTTNTWISSKMRYFVASCLLHSGIYKTLNMEDLIKSNFNEDVLLLLGIYFITAHFGELHPLRRTQLLTVNSVLDPEKKAHLS